MTGRVLIWSGPAVMLLGAILQATAPEHRRGSDGMLVQIYAFTAVAFALIIAGGVVLAIQS